MPRMRNPFEMRRANAERQKRRAQIMAANAQARAATEIKRANIFRIVGPTRHPSQFIGARPGGGMLKQRSRENNMIKEDRIKVNQIKAGRSANSRLRDVNRARLNPVNWGDAFRVANMRSLEAKRLMELRRRRNPSFLDRVAAIFRR